MISLTYKNSKIYLMEKSDVEKLISQNKGEKLVVPEIIDNMRVQGTRKGSFDEVVGIKEIVFPASLIYVEFMAITNCDVERITFGKDLSFIDLEGLRTNKKLKHIEIEKGGQYHSSIQGNLYNADGKILKYGCNDTIAEGTIQIGFLSFVNTDVESIVIPESVTEISNNAFIKCKKLKTVQFTGQNLITIGDRAFEECESLEAIKIPGSVLLIGTQAFNSTGLKELIFEDRGEVNRKLRIGPRAFKGTNIRIVDFSKVKHVVIETEAFRGAKVANLTLNGMVNLGAQAFKSCKIEEITFKSISLYGLADKQETLGKHTIELKKLVEQFNKKDIEVTYILHDNIWIEDRFW